MPHAQSGPPGTPVARGVHRGAALHFFSAERAAKQVEAPEQVHVSRVQLTTAAVAVEVEVVDVVEVAGGLVAGGLVAAGGLVVVGCG